MQKEDSIVLFKQHQVRRHWDDEQELWYFSVVDVIEILTGSNRPRKYWNDLKKRLFAEGSELSEKIGQLKMLASDGKMRVTDVADTEQLLRLIQSIPSPKAEPFKLWLAKVGYERIEETEDPELAFDRAIQWNRCLVPAKCRSFIFLFLLVLSKTAFSYMYTQVGINSNFLIESDKIYFAQSDNTLTVLSLETGEVLARKKNFKYGGSFFLTENGLLVQKYKNVAMINLSTLDIIWQADDTYDSEVFEEYLISYDGNGLVQNRYLATGNTAWKYNLLGALDIVVENEKVLLFRSATYDGPDGIPAVVLLDIHTGKELFHKTTPPGIHYIGAYFDGDKIYLLSGAYQEASSAKNKYDSGRATAEFEKLLVWDLEGNEIFSETVPADFDQDQITFKDSFSFVGKVFSRGHIWDNLDDLPPWKPGMAKSRERYDSEDDLEIRTSTFDLVNGKLNVIETVDMSGRKKIPISIEAEPYNWKGVLPYLNRGKIEIVGSTKEKILLGSNLGHVECIDAKTGTSIWMYIFPTIRDTVSYSSHGMPPYMSTALNIFKKENQRKVVSGMMLEGSEESPNTKIIYDPSPSNPYEKLPQFLIIAWAGAIIPIAFLCLNVVIGNRRKWDIRSNAALGLICTIITIGVLFFYGRVSISSSIFLRLSIISSLFITFFYSVAVLRRRCFLSGSFLLLLAICITVYIFPAFLTL